MFYWKFAAYDQNYQTVEGMVATAANSDLAMQQTILNFRNNGLQIMKLESSTASEYKQYKRLEAFKNRVQPQPTKQPSRKPTIIQRLKRLFFFRS